MSMSPALSAAVELKETYSNLNHNLCFCIGW